AADAQAAQPLPPAARGDSGCVGTECYCEDKSLNSSEIAQAELNKLLSECHPGSPDLPKPLKVNCPKTAVKRGRPLQSRCRAVNLSLIGVRVWRSVSQTPKAREQFPDSGVAQFLFAPGV